MTGFAGSTRHCAPQGLLAASLRKGLRLVSPGKGVRAAGQRKGRCGELCEFATFGKGGEGGRRGVKLEAGGFFGWVGFWYFISFRVALVGGRQKMFGTLEKVGSGRFDVFSFWFFVRFAGF